MKDYKEYIENLAVNKTDMIFENSSAEHASIVMATLFKHSKKDLKIYAGNLCGDVSNGNNEILKKEYSKQLFDFIERKGNLSILLDEVTDKFKSSELYLRLQFYKILYPNRVSLKCISNTFPEKDRMNHFTIGDGVMFRYEQDMEKYTAVGSFNNPMLAGKLDKIFETMFSSSKEISIN